MVCIQRFAEGPPNRHLIYTAGEDFHYQVISHDMQLNIYDMKTIDFTKKKTSFHLLSIQNANQNFKNMDKLIKYVNEITPQTGIEILYSTPTCYMKGLYDDLVNFFPDFTWTEKTDDFFPYASGAHSYWTGFFTSRPTLKYMERQHNNLLQVSKQVQALYVNKKSKVIFSI